MSELGRRIELHTHSLLSDGGLTPSEIASRAQALDYETIAVTDHVDGSNLDLIAKRLAETFNDLQGSLDVTLIPGVELTHVPPDHIMGMAKRAKELGAKIVIAHGETIVEPVAPGTNKAAASCTFVDILAHPGLVTCEEARLAKENEVFMELNSRVGHCLANGQVARVATEVGAKLVVGTDMHDPGELLSQELAFKIAIGSGLEEDTSLKVVKDYPRDLLKRLDL